MISKFPLLDGLIILLSLWLCIPNAYSFDAKDKTVKIVLDSESFGDLIAWIGAIDEFQKKHQ